MELRAATRIPPLEQPLSDGTITLRLTAERDIPEILVAHDGDRDLYRRRGLTRPPSGAELGRQREEAPALRAQGLVEELTIVAGSGPGGDFLGQVIIHHIHWHDRRAELGIWLASDARGNAVGRRALALTAGWLFGPGWGLQRLQLNTEPDNDAMIACARAAGFELEGTLRGFGLEDGRRVDEVVMSLVSAQAARP